MREAGGRTGVGWTRGVKGIRGKVEKGRERWGKRDEKGRRVGGSGGVLGGWKGREGLGDGGGGAEAGGWRGQRSIGGGG